MFAPRVKATKPETASQDAPVQAPKPPQHRFGSPAGRLSDQAMVRHGSQSAESLTGRKSGEPPRETEQALETGPETTPSVSWDLLKLTMLTPVRARRPETSPPPVRPKLVIGQVNDPLEREADRMAEQVMRLPAPELAGKPAPPHVSLEGASRDRMGTVRKEPTAAALAPEAPGIVHDVLRSPGQPLDVSSRAYFEPRFGHDFSQVRIHADARATASARAVNARAYTAGQHVVFGAGAYSPQTEAGRKLLAHELTHTIQQASHAPATASLGAATLRRSPDIKLPKKSTRDPRRLIEERMPRPIEGQVPKPVPNEEGKWVIEWSWEKPVSEHEREQIYWATFEVDANGVMRISARTKKPGAMLHAPKKFGDLFNEALRIFEKHNIEVRAFEAEWGYMAPHEISSNLDEFFRALRENPRLSHEDAAKKTPSGRLATAHKFTEVTILDIGWGKLPGERGTHVRPEVRVRFAKPGSGTIPAAPTSGTAAPAQGPLPISGASRTPTKTKPIPPGASARETLGRQATPATSPGGPRVAEGRGKPIAPISVPQPATTIASKKAGIEGAVGMILAYQLSALREAELQKAVDALVQLGPEIERYHEQGFSVTVKLIVEVPKQVDIAAIWAGVGDVSQVVRFRKLFISHVTPVKKSSAASTHSTMSENLAPGDPERQDPHEWTLHQQLEQQLGVEFPVPGTGPRKGTKFVTRELALPAPSAGEPTGRRAREASSHFPGIAGTYRPVFERGGTTYGTLLAGGPSVIPLLLQRQLRVEQGPDGKLLPMMWRGSKLYSYQHYRADPPVAIKGLFTIGEEDSSEAERIWTRMEYHNGLILEMAQGLDKDGNTMWDAVLRWEKV